MSQHIECLHLLQLDDWRLVERVICSEIIVKENLKLQLCHVLTTFETRQKEYVIYEFPPNWYQIVNWTCQTLLWEWPQKHFDFRVKSYIVFKYLGIINFLIAE